MSPAALPPRRTLTPPTSLPALLLLSLVAWLRAAGSPAALESTALEPRSGPRGATLFTEMPVSTTGLQVENQYNDPRMWSERYHEFGVGAIGTGCAIGDFDGDGRPDILVVSKIESPRLFRNLGNWHFEDVSEKAGIVDKSGEWKQGASFVDVNNDGRLDIFITRFKAPSLLYVNQGDGRFTEEAAARGLALVDACASASFADYDRDGALDLYLQTNLLSAAVHPRGQRDHLFHNDGKGVFSDVSTQAGIGGETQGHSATWWDFDNDGWPDLYVANDFECPDFLYRNNRDGSFTNVIKQLVPHTPLSSMGSDLGDVNNDGLVDFFVADMAASTHQKDQRGMAVSRARALDYTEDPLSPPQYLRNALFLNTGTARCQEAAVLAGVDATDWTWSPRFEDLDEDGRLDLIVTNGMNREQHNADLLERTMVSESASERVRLMRSSPVLNEPNLAFRNLGDLRFESVGAAWGLDKRGVSFGSAFGDLDGDGDLDFVFINYQGGLTVLRNDNDQGHHLIVELHGTRSNRFGIGALVRIETEDGPQVRPLVLTRGYLSSSEPIVHFGLGARKRVLSLSVTWPDGRVQHFDGPPIDRRLSITESDTAQTPSPGFGRAAPLFSAAGKALGLEPASAEESTDQTLPQPLLPMRRHRRGPALAVGRLGVEPQPSLVLGGTPLSPLALLRRPSATSPYFAQALDAAKSDLPVDDGPVLIFDADGDGLNDLLVTRGGANLPAGNPAYQPLLLLNRGSASFVPAPTGSLPELPLSAGAAAAVDFDGDGRLDLFLGARVVPGSYPAPARSALLLNRGGGRFEDVTALFAPDLASIGLVSSALWTDLDGDGRPDLVLALEWGGVRYFHNRDGRALEDLSEAAGFSAAGSGWWSSLASADLNGDGRPDIVAGNVGLNTPYRSGPALLFTADFKGGGGQAQLVEAYYEEGKLYPRRTRKDLGAKIPAVLRKFPKNDLYARATLGEILGDDKLAAARRYEATEFRSGVFLSSPEGHYRFQPLPRIAQIAPVQGLAVCDLDGDGNTDIALVQNSYAPLPSVGRFDSGIGQILLGDGHGSFRALPPAVSGFVVPGDAKALIAADLDGDGAPDLLASRNNDTCLAFVRTASPESHYLAVSLEGPRGNPEAIGARLSLTMADGATQTLELQAGSGCYSQQAATLWFGAPSSNPPRLLRVRWPSGATREYPVPTGTSQLRLPAP